MVDQIEVVPNYCSDNRKKSPERMRPLGPICHETEQQVREKCSPNLPLNSVLVVTKEISQLKRLFHLFEEYLNSPTSRKYFCRLAVTQFFPRKVRQQIHWFRAVMHFNQS